MDDAKKDELQHAATNRSYAMAKWIAANGDKDSKVLWAKLNIALQEWAAEISSENDINKSKLEWLHKWATHEKNISEAAGDRAGVISYSRILGEINKGEE